jgi:predicted nucleotidyltransferase
MDDLLMYNLRSMTVEQMAQLPDVREGLESRLYRLSRETGTAEALLEALKCKRYTHARLSRLLAHAMLNMTQSLIDANPVPTYGRIIAMGADAGPLLKEISDRATIPVVSNVRQIKDDPVFELECRATDIWALLHDEPSLRLPGREFTEKFIRAGRCE